MQIIRNAVPNVIATARSREHRLAQAALLFAAVLFGAVSCSDGSVTEPLAPVNPVAGLKTQYDSVASPEEKNAPAPIYSRASSLEPLASASGAGSLTNIASIAFAPEAGPFANQLPGCDDCLFGGATGFPIGFSLNYYGENYTSFWISSNGFVAFTRPTSNGCCHGRPLPLFDMVNNMVAVAWLDLKPQPGQMSFETRGDAPSRRLIINYQDVVAVGETPRTVTAQLVLFEGTNVIELHTTALPQMVSHSVTQGAENAPGTEAAFVEGRVASRAFALSNDAVRFSGAPVNAVPVAFPGGNAGSAPNLFYEGVEGSTVRFTGSGTDLDNDELTYSWDFNNDGQADATTAEATWTWVDDGTHSAVLSVSDGRGGVGQARVDVVIENVAPQVNAGDDLQIKAGETVNLSGRFSDPGANDNPWKWTWNIATQAYVYGNDSNDQTAPILGSHRFCRAGTHQAKLTVVDKDGASGEDELTVTVDALPVQILIAPRKITLNGKNHGMVSVLIYSSATVNATQLNPSTLKLTGGNGRGTSLARTGGGLWQWRTTMDLNGDGLRDAVAWFHRADLVKNGDLSASITELRLDGMLGDCGDVRGAGPIRVRVKAKNNSAASSLDDDSDSDSDEG